MSKCSIAQQTLLPKEVLDGVKSSHKDSFIGDLTASQQRSVVKYIFNKLYTESVKGKEFATSDLKSYLISQIDSKIASFEADLVIAAELAGIDPSLDTSKDTVEAIRLLKSVRENLDALIKKGLIEAKTIRGIKVENTEDSEDDLISILEHASEVSRDRTDHSDDFSLLIDSKKNAPGKLKEFLSFISKARFNDNKEVIPVTTFFNTEAYFEYGEIYDELHRLLEGVYPSKEAVFQRLKEINEKAIATKNNSLAWVGKFIEVLEAENKKVDSEVLALFIRDMTKHHVQMEYVYLKEIPPREGSTVYINKLVVANDNSTTAFRRVRGAWKSTHMYAPIVDQSTNLYDQVKRDALVQRINEALKVKGDGQFKARALAIRAYMELMGLEVPRDFIIAMASGEATVYAGKQRLNSSKKILDRMRLSLSAIQATPENPKIAADFELLPDPFITGLAKASISYSNQEFSNVMWVGDKAVYTYTANHNLSNRIRDLKAGGFSKLKDVAFSKFSIYGNALLNELDGFDESFGMSYVSLYPLAVENELRKLDGATKLSEIDSEVMHIGFALRNDKERVSSKSFLLSDGSSVQLNVQSGSYVAPTMSDKTRAMLLNGFTFRVSQLVKYKEKTRTVISPEAIRLYIDGVVKGEMERIKLSADVNYVDALNLSSYNGGLFYLTPYLNNLYFLKTENEGDNGAIEDVWEVSKEGVEGAISLPELIAADLMSKAEVSSVVNDAIFKAVRVDLHLKGEQRYKTWNKLGLVNDKGFISKHHTHKTALRGLDGVIQDGNADAMELAMDITFSEEISNANFFQLIASDPAQYNKAVNEADYSSQSEINNDEVAATYSVVTKRLASEIAPGDDADVTGQEDYYQVFLNDIYQPSENVNDIVEILDGKDARKKLEELALDLSEEGVAILDTYIASLVSAPYFNIETTNAQEYVTWKTHIKEMLRYGELTPPEYDLIYSTISAGKPIGKDLLKKVMGPRKPVYSNSAVVNVDKNGTNKILKKTYIKTSSMVLLPQVYETTKLNGIRVAMEKLERQSGKSVRSAYKSGVKVGFPSEGLSLTDSNGVFLKDPVLIPGKNTLILNTEGFRIQQSVPFAEDKKAIKVGSQSKKLLFTNLLKKTFSYKGKNYTGLGLRKEYEIKFRELSDAGLKRFNEFITDEDGKTNNAKLAYLLKKELQNRGETSKPVLDGLAINKKTGEFKTPLYKSAYADQYMALMNSIVQKYILNHKMFGVSSVLASEAGVVDWDTSQGLPGFDGIIYSPSFDRGKGLQGQRLGPNGEILPAQIILPFKFRDNEGKLLDLRDFIDPETNLLDLSKLPAELLESYSFRIPTQLQQSMAYVEIVGFVPYTLGDTVIASKDFIIQMGSDFDVDKLYSYLFNTDYSDGVLSKLKPITLAQRDKRLAEIDAEIEELYTKEVTPKELKKAIRDAVKVAIMESGPNLETSDKAAAKKEMLSRIYAGDFGEIKKLGAEKIISDKVYALEMEKRELEDRYIKSLDNEILDIEKAVMLNREAQRFIMKPLGNANYINHANKIEGLNTRNKGLDSIISHAYNARKMDNGNAGRDGISIFSSDSILQAYMEGKTIQITEDVIDEETGKPYRIPVYIGFGTKYKVSSGALGLSTTLKKDNDGTTVSEFISALQNVSVDNANLEAMAKVNMNTTTAGVYSLLHMLGFEDDITTHFMSQPIIVEYVKKLANLRGIHAENTYNGEEKAIADLKATYAPDYVPSMHRELAEFNHLDAVEHMTAMLEYGEEMGPEFGLTQVAILEKFLELQGHAHTLNSVKKLLNLDSKGLNKNFYSTKMLLTSLETLPKLPIEGLQQLVGDFYMDDQHIWHFVRPTTLAGYDIVNGAKTLISAFGNEFIESKPSLNFSGIVKHVQETLYPQGNRVLNEMEIYALRKEYLNYLNSDLKDKDVAALRQELFYNSDENSLYAKLLRLRKTNYAKSNKFLSSLSMAVSQEGLISINFDRVPGDNFSNDAIYEAFVDALINEVIVDTPEGPLNVSEVMQSMVYYGVLKGGKASTSFYKFIPPSIINKISNPPEVQRSSYTFLKQYFQNNFKGLPRVKEKDIVFNEDKSKVTLTGTDSRPLAIRVGAELYILISESSGTYSKVSTKQHDNVSTYIYKPQITPVQGEKVVKKDDTNNSHFSSLTSLSGKKLSQLYEKYADVNLINTREILRRALIDSGTDITVTLVDEIDEGVIADYNPNSHVIRVSKKLAKTMSDEALLSVIMHEHLHHASVDTLLKMAEGTIPITESVSRIQLNIHQLIDRFIKMNSEYSEAERTAALKTMVFYYHEHQGKNRATDALFTLSTHPIVKKAIYDIRNGVTLEGLLASGDTSVLDLNTAYKIVRENDMRSVVHSITSIFEYVAIVPTEDSRIQELISREYPTIIGNILAFLQDVLELLGVQSPELRRALADIYSLSNIKPSVPSTPVAKEQISVMRNTDIITIKGNEFVYQGGSPIQKDNTLFSTIAKQFIEKMGSMISKGDLTPIADPYTVLGDTNSSLYNRLLAKASLDPDDKSFNGDFGFTGTLEVPSTKPSDKDSIEDPLDLLSKNSTKSAGSESNISNTDDAKWDMRSLIDMGKQAIKECHGKKASTTKWSVVDAQVGIKAEKGLYVPNERIRGNDTWEVVTTLKGPSHAKGGIQLSINDGKVSMTHGDSPFEAKYGMVIPYEEPVNNLPKKEENRENLSNFTKSGKVKYTKKKVGATQKPIAKVELNRPTPLKVDELDISVQALVDSPDPILYRDEYKKLQSKRDNLLKLNTELWQSLS